MYIPKAFRVDEREALTAFMRAHNFATLVTNGAAGLTASSVPLTVHDDGALLRLTGHLAKANPQAQDLAGGDGLVLFAGPHAYISPTWYEARESVPTWNYQVVHVYGKLRALRVEDAPAEIEQMLADLVAQHEPGYQAQWDSLPEKYRDGMRHGIVGFELTAERVEGKFKLSQNRSATDQATVAAALSASANAEARATGAAMQRGLEGRA